MGFSTSSHGGLDDCNASITKVFFVRLGTTSDGFKLLKTKDDMKLGSTAAQVTFLNFGYRGAISLGVDTNEKLDS